MFTFDFDALGHSAHITVSPFRDVHVLEEALLRDHSTHLVISEPVWSCTWHSPTHARILIYFLFYSFLYLVRPLSQKYPLARISSIFQQITHQQLLSVLTTMNDDIFDNMTDDMTDATDDKRKSRVRHWAKRLGRCLSKCQPRRRCKASYLDTENPIPPPYRVSVTDHMPRHAFSIRKWKSASLRAGSTNSRVNNTSSLRAFPSQGKLQANKRSNIRFERTIRLVNSSVSSLVGGPGSQSTRSPRKGSLFAPQESDIDETVFEEIETKNEGRGQEPLPGPRSVLSWLDSFHANQVFRRGSPRPPTLRNDSAADLTVRPGQTRPHPADDIYRRTSPTQSATSTQGKSSAGIRICHPHPIQSHVALDATSSENIKIWEQDWDEPTQHRPSSLKGLWRSPSQRLVVRNKASIQRLQAESAEQDKTPENKQTGSQRLSQMRSMDRLQKIAEEERKADEEWSGTWKAFDRAFGGLAQS